MSVKKNMLEEMARRIWAGDWPITRPFSSFPNWLLFAFHPHPSNFQNYMAHYFPCWSLSLFPKIFHFFPYPSKKHFSLLFSSVLNHAAPATFPLFPLLFDSIGLQLSTLVFCEAAFHSSQVDWFLTGEEQVHLYAVHSDFHRTTCWASDTCSESLPQQY